MQKIYHKDTRREGVTVRRAILCPPSVEARPLTSRLATTLAPRMKSGAHGVTRPTNHVVGFFISESLFENPNDTPGKDTRPTRNGGKRYLL